MSGHLNCLSTLIKQLLGKLFAGRTILNVSKVCCADNKAFDLRYSFPLHGSICNRPAWQSPKPNTVPKPCLINLLPLLPALKTRPWDCTHCKGGGRLSSARLQYMGLVWRLTNGLHPSSLPLFLPMTLFSKTCTVSPNSILTFLRGGMAAWMR